MEKTTEKTTKQKIWSGICNVVLLVIGLSVATTVVPIIIGSFSQSETKKEAGEIIKDILYDREITDPEIQPYSQIMIEMYEPLKIAYADLAKADTSVGNLADTDLFEMSSFADYNRMLEIKTILEVYLQAQSNYFIAVDDMKANIRPIVRKYISDEKEVNDCVKAIETGQTTMTEIVSEYLTTSRAFHNEIISLYEFLLVNWDSYEIDGENILFELDSQIERYDTLIERIMILGADVMVLDDEFKKTTDEFFTDYGLKIEDLEQYFQQ